MSKSRVAPGYSLFQLVIQDFKHRKPSNNNFYINRDGSRSVREVVETIPTITKLRWKKNSKQAIKSVKKFGTVISCRKVGSHFNRLQMIEHLQLDVKPIYVDITAEEFTVGRDLEIEPMEKKRKIDMENT